MTLATHGVFPPNKDQLDELMAWRAEALETMPYFARVLRPAAPSTPQGSAPSPATLGYRLDIDFEAVSPKGVPWCAEALLHECGHLYNDHAARAREHAVKDDERFTWNLSGDATINDDLVAAGRATIANSTVLPASLCMDDHLLAGQYMDELCHQRPLSSPSGGFAGQPRQPRLTKGEGTDQPFGGCESGSDGAAAPCELDPDDDPGGAAPAASETEKKRSSSSSPRPPRCASTPPSTPARRWPGSSSEPR
jgi:hypothetical protein